MRDLSKAGSPPYVVPEMAASVTENELKRHVRDNLANYIVPREIRILDALPRSSTGKILQAELHEFIADS